MNPYEKAFLETLFALGQEQLDNLIIIGGWCPYLFAVHAWKRDVPLLGTVDIDFAVKKMSPDRFSIPVYKMLADAKLIPRKMNIDDENRVQFAYVSAKENIFVPVEFVTAPSVLPKGQKILMKPYVACDPLPEIEIALKMTPIWLTIPYHGKNLSVQSISPTAFIIVKGLLIKHRSNIEKTPKDLASIAFVLRFSPDPEKVVKKIYSLSKHESVKEFSCIIKDLFQDQDETRRGFVMLEPYFREWGIPQGRIENEIALTFKPLFSIFESCDFR